MHTSQLWWLLALAWTSFLGACNGQLGAITTSVQWRAAHAAAFLDPFVVLYGGVENPNASTNSTNLSGSSSVWVWDSRNGSWYHPQIAGTNQPLPQAYIHSVELPSSGQMLAVASNTSDGSTTGVLQLLDTNGWTWSFPTSGSGSSSPAAGYAMTIVNNTIYTYGGVSVDSTGYPMSSSVLNSLSTLDSTTYDWSSGANGIGIVDHSTCYVPACNCLITFGGTSTGSVSDATNTVYIYDLTQKTWNLQVSVGSVNGAIPGARVLHTATCLQNSMVVYGGGTTQAFDTSVWVLDVSKYPTLTWELMSVANMTNSPNARMGHSAVLDPKTNRIFMFGGWGVSANGDTNMYILDTQSWSWSRIAPTETLSSDGSVSSGDNSSSNSSSSNIPAIVGGAVGGVSGLALLSLAVFLLYRRRKNKQSNLSSKRSMGDGSSPFSWNQDDYQGEHGESLSWVKRVSKAMTSGSRSHHSLMGLSEYGDGERSRSGTLAYMTDPSSFRSSKVWAPVDMSSRQVPDEAMLQKPNEFSVPIARSSAQASIPVEHYHPPHTPTSPGLSDVAPFSSLEVMQSKDGSHAISAPYMTTVLSEKGEGNEEGWTSEAITCKTNEPIQYIQPSNPQFSIATTTASGHPHVDVTHNEAPSGSVPVAVPVSLVTSALTSPTSSRGKQSTPTSIYDTLSPLDRLASLGRTGEANSLPLDEADPHSIPPRPQSAVNSDPIPVPVDVPAPVPVRISAPPQLPALEAAPPSNPSSLSTSGDSGTNEDAWNRFASILPRQFRIDRTRAPILGPTNSVVYVERVSTENKGPEVIKLFGRREAWERECRALNKLKSPHVVSLLEIITFGSSDKKEDEDDEGKTTSNAIRYGTVMETLDETLATVIRRARIDPQVATHWTPAFIRSIVRDIIGCLTWCHANGIAFCDLKPSNLMRKKEGHWKLIDFEASRRIGEECVGVITPRYCPPEVARATTYGLEGANGVVATANVDFWAVGCIIYELETKQPLFATTIKDDTILHFVSHPSPSTPILNNGLRWNEQRELEIPQLDQLVTDADARAFMRILLSRDPSKRTVAGTTQSGPTSLLNHTFFDDPTIDTV